MFVGEFKHSFDAKNRLVIPSKFRAFITTKEDSKGFFVIAGTVPGKRCLLLYTMSKWMAVAQELRIKADLAKDPAHFLRYFASRGEFAPFDKQNRIVVPQKLIDYAGLQKDVLLVGNIDWIEVWKDEEYRAETESLDEEIGEQVRMRALWASPVKEAGK